MFFARMILQSGGGGILARRRKFAGAGRLAGFTLVEMLVVMAIIGILAGIFFPMQTALRNRAYRVKSLDQAQQIAQAWMFLYQDERAFPVDAIKTLPKSSVDAGDYMFPMTDKALKVVAEYYEATDLQKQVGLLSAWGERKAGADLRQAGKISSLKADDYADDIIWVKLDTNYDGEVEWKATKVKRAVIAWSPGETPNSPVNRTW